MTSNEVWQVTQITQTLGEAFYAWSTIPELDQYVNYDPDHFLHPTKKRLREAYDLIEPYLTVFEGGWCDHDSGLITDADWKHWESYNHSVELHPLFLCALNAVKRDNGLSKPYLNDVCKRVRADLGDVVLKGLCPELVSQK